jgi:hypothetical protein
MWQERRHWIMPKVTIGLYHGYDNQFFYRNLQDNVNVRVKEYNKTHHDPNSVSWNDYKPGTMGTF